jgi:hypothetical protein
MRALILFLSVTLALLLVGADGPRRRPLDLPSGGGVNVPTEDDEIPESIQFYGRIYEGDAFMFVVDFSGSMGRADGDKWNDLLHELVLAIEDLSSGAELGLLAFSDRIEIWNPEMIAAGPNARRSAIEFLGRLVPGGTTCISTGVVAGLKILRTSTLDIDSRRLILIGDGAHYCQGQSDSEPVEQDIQHGNWDRHHIDTVFIGSWQKGIELFTHIARQNRGQFRIVQ